MNAQAMISNDNNPFLLDGNPSDQKVYHDVPSVGDVPPVKSAGKLPLLGADDLQTTPGPDSPRIM